MDSRSYASVIKHVCALTSQQPTETMMMNITQWIRARDLSRMKRDFDHDVSDYTIEDSTTFHEYLANAYVTQIKSRKSDQVIITKQALHKNEPPASKTGAHIMTIIVDSFNRDTSRDSSDARIRSLKGITDFGFTLSTRDDRSALGTGRVPSRVVPAGITYMKVGKVTIPYSQSMGLLNTSRELSLTLTGVRNNGAYMSNQGSTETIHFSFYFMRCPFNQELALLEPINRFCWFDPPLAYLTDVSMRWSDPHFPVEFPNDRLTVSSIDYNSTDGRITFAVDHQLVTGDVVVVTGFDTEEKRHPSIVSNVNSKRGHRVTRIDDRTIAIGVDLTSIDDEDLNNKPLIVFASKCFRLPIEIGFNRQEHA